MYTSTEDKISSEIKAADRTSTVITVILCAAVTMLAIVSALIFIQSSRRENSADIDDGGAYRAETSSSGNSSGSGAAGAPEPEVPDWVTRDYIVVNEYSRPGTPLTEVNGVVVHYVGNPGTTAKQNRDYFNNLATTHERHASSHFIVDTDGSVIQCIPLDEVAYCSNDRNYDTIAIECCHPDETGKFTDVEIESLTKLLRWLISTYDLEREDIIRHYDVTGKICPKYYVENPDEWESFRDSLFDTVWYDPDMWGGEKQSGNIDEIFENH